MTTLTQFKKKVQTTMGRADTVRNRVQDHMIEAANHAEEHSDFGFFDVLVNAAIGNRALNTDQMIRYIKAHVSNITWGEHKDGKRGFKKLKKGTPCEFSPMQTPWYEYEEPGMKNKPTPYNEDKARSTLKKVAKRLESEAEFDDDQVANLLIEFATSLQSGEIDLGVKSA